MECQVDAMGIGAKVMEATSRPGLQTSPGGLLLSLPQLAGWMLMYRVVWETWTEGGEASVRLCPTVTF